jgi:diguanylate cyclase (GGDEF)-like protein
MPGRNISAVASIDMNGLKTLNDTKGHAEGDRALTVIGRCLNEVSTRNIIPYRVGGDEFTILFADQGEETVRKTLERLKESVAAAGYHVAVGYTMNRGGGSLDELLRDSDQNMYKDKAEFYQQKGHDRRTRN